MVGVAAVSVILMVVVTLVVVLVALLVVTVAIAIVIIVATIVRIVTIVVADDLHMMRRFVNDNNLAMSRLALVDDNHVMMNRAVLFDYDLAWAWVLLDYHHIMARPLFDNYGPLRMIYPFLVDRPMANRATSIAASAANNCNRQ